MVIKNNLLSFIIFTYYFYSGRPPVSNVRFDRDTRSLLDADDSDGALSAPEMSMTRRKERGVFIKNYNMCFIFLQIIN